MFGMVLIGKVLVLWLCRPLGNKLRNGVCDHSWWYVICKVLVIPVSREVWPISALRFYVTGTSSVLHHLVFNTFLQGNCRDLKSQSRLFLVICAAVNETREVKDKTGAYELECMGYDKSKWRLG